MPNITEFDAGNLRLQPSEIGVESTAAAGRRIGVYGSQIAGSYERLGAEAGQTIRLAGDAAVEHMAHQEISAGAPSGAQLFADQLEKKDAAIKAIDPNDPHYGQKVELAVKQWRDEQLEPALDQFKQGFNTEKGQQWAENFIDRTRQTMFVHSTADVATAAGIGIHNSARTLVNTATSTVFRDPSMLDSQLDLVEHGLTGLVQSSPVKGTEAARIQSETTEKAKEQIVKSAIQGAIMRGAPWQQIANKYPDYVNGAEMKSFERAEVAQTKAIEANSRAAELEQRRLQAEDAKNSIAKINGDYLKTDPTSGHVTVGPGYFTALTELAIRNPQAGNEARTWINWGMKLNDRAAKAEKIVSDPAHLQDLGDRILDPDKPTTVNDTIRAETQGDLSHADGNRLRHLIDLRDKMPNDPTFKFATDQAKAQIEGGSPVSKLHAAGKYAAFMQDFMTEYMRERSLGTIPANALDLTDPNSLISQKLAPYKRSIGQTVKDNGGVGSRPAPAPATPAVAAPPKVPAGLNPNPPPASM